MVCPDSFLGKLKRMEKSFVFILSFFFVVCSFAGCKSSEDAGKSNDEETVIENDSDNEEKGDEKDDGEDEEENTGIRECNPLNLKNFVCFENGARTNSYSDVSVIAVQGDNYDGNTQIGKPELIAAKDDIVVLSYFAGEITINEDYKETGSPEDIYNKYNYKYRQHLVSLDTKDLSVKKELEFDNDVIINCKNEHIYVSSSDYENGKYNYTVYDFNLEQLYSHDFNESIALFLNKDLSAGYYSYEDKLKCFNVADNKVADVDVKDYEQITYVSDFGETPGGNEYVLASVVASDKNSYTAMIDVKTGETIKVFPYASYFPKYKDNQLTLSEYDDKGITYINLPDNTKGYSYELKSNQDTRIMQVLSKENVIGVVVKDNGVTLYKYENDKQVASTKIIFDKKLVNEIAKFTNDEPQIFKDSRSQSEAMDPVDYVNAYIFDDFFELPNGDILFSVSANNCQYYLIWTPTDDNIENITKIEKITINDIESPLIETKEDFEKYTPGELSADKKILREKADDMEKRYGVDIRIGEECKDYFGGYAMQAVTDFNTVSEALEELEIQLKRYPDGFFEQFADDWYSGLLINLSGTIIGVSDGGLDKAGGFQYSIDDKRVIVIDSSYRSNVNETFNHELCHAIEGVIWDRHYFEEDYCLSNDNWNKLNPKTEDDIYTFDYSKFGNEKYMDYATGWEDYSDRYFVDDYSMTFPTEDRARIFEEVMTGDHYIDMDSATHLQDKLNYYCKCIRDTFDTTGWKDVPWEKYYVE